MHTKNKSHLDGIRERIRPENLDIHKLIDNSVDIKVITGLNADIRAIEIYHNVDIGRTVIKPFKKGIDYYENGDVVDSIRFRPEDPESESMKIIAEYIKEIYRQNF